MMNRLSFIEAAYQILRREGKPLSAEEITSLAFAENLIATSGKTPAATMGAGIYVDIKRKGENSRFVKGEKRGTFYLRELMGGEKVKGTEPNSYYVKNHYL